MTVATPSSPAERAESMRAFFAPASIAVVGASPNPARGGHRILVNLLEHYEGEIYAVNPSADSVLGLRCYPSVAAIPGEIDLAVVFIPASAVPQVVRECVVKGVRAVCIESGGFADAGSDGERLQREIEELAVGTVTRLWGPNCAGYVSTDPPISTSFVVTPGTLELGNVSLVAQSGMMAAALLVQILSQELFAISKACSIGNKADVDESDLLEYLAGDERSEVIAFYLESIVDGQRFAAAADVAVERATMLALVGGVSETGARVAISHTGSVASSEAAVAGMLRQRGVLQCNDFMELVDLAGALAMLRVRECGNRVAVLTFSGAAGVVTADLFARHGLELAQLAPRTLERLAEIYPPWLAPENPVDVWSTVELRGLERTITRSLEALLDDDGVDAILFMPLAFEFFAEPDLDAFARLAATSAKPIVAWPFGEDAPLALWRRTLRQGNVAVCRSLYAAVRVLEALVLRDRALERLRVVTPAAERDGVLPQQKVLGEEEAKRILADFGVPVVEERRATVPGAAVAAAGEIGYPVVLKLARAGLAHKTELGGVVLGLRDPAAVEAAAARLLASLEGAHLLVQPFVEDGVETIVGARRDASFGPLVLFGMGGVHVEALRDVAVRPAPLVEADARAMIAEVRAAKLLEGSRGRPPADVKALVGALLAMSDFIATVPDVLEAEVNPLLVRSHGAVAVDALIVR
jgi:acetate---CoA ligase (ADP-forming)